MKLIINRETLLTPLQQIVGVIEKRQTMPVLANVLLLVKDNYLTLTGTDLEIQLVSKIEIKELSPGSITVPARKLLDLCRLLPIKADIQIELSGDKLKILSNRSRFSLSCLPSEHYPEFAESEMDKKFSINSGKFKKALEKTTFCMANQDVRYYLNGLLLNISNTKFKLVASDGHRLSIYEDTLDEATGYEGRIILPRKGVLELYRLLDNPDINLNILFSSNNVKIAINNLVFSAKLVDAKYPDFSKVFQQPFFEAIPIQKQELKDALTRVAVLANEKFKGVTLDILPGNIKISTHNPEHDEGEEEVSVEYNGEHLSIAFNAQYILEALSNIDSDTVILTVAKNVSTCFIDESNQSEYRFIVMPMRI
jgi:DNA polymerase III subunit beta